MLSNVETILRKLALDAAAAWELDGDDLISFGIPDEDIEELPYVVIDVGLVNREQIGVRTVQERLSVTVAGRFEVTENTGSILEFQIAKAKALGDYLVPESTSTAKGVYADVAYGQMVAAVELPPKEPEDYFVDVVLTFVCMTDVNE